MYQVLYRNASRAGGVPARRAVELYVSVMTGVFKRAATNDYFDSRLITDYYFFYSTRQPRWRAAVHRTD